MFCITPIPSFIFFLLTSMTFTVGITVNNTGTHVYLFCYFLLKIKNIRSTNFSYYSFYRAWHQTKLATNLPHGTSRVLTSQLHGDLPFRHLHVHFVKSRFFQPKKSLVLVKSITNYVSSVVCSSLFFIFISILFSCVHSLM